MKKLIFITLLITAPVVISFAQPQPSSNANSTPVAGDPIGGSAPLGSGIALLLTLATGYGTKKVLNLRKKLAK